MNVGHSRFLAERSSHAQWHEPGDVTENGEVDSAIEEQDSVADGKGKQAGTSSRPPHTPDHCIFASPAICITDSRRVTPGKLSPTSSHLFKLILPMDKFQPNGVHTGIPTVFLVHPSQPLSHISRLIAASLAPEIPKISFRSTAPGGRHLAWSDSTDVGDFIRDAARATEFEIHIAGNQDQRERLVQVEVPSFADRTRFLRRRLGRIERELQSMEALKARCDKEAHEGARKMAVGGLGMLVVYWGTVARLTFWDLGWCVVENDMRRASLYLPRVFKQGCNGTSDISVRAFHGHPWIPVVRHL